MSELVKLTAKEIIEKVSSRVVGQEDMKRAVAIAIRGRHLADKANLRGDSLDPALKPNVLLSGPTGCGKSELARTLERLGYPILNVKCTSFTPVGIVGDKVPTVPTKFLEKVMLNGLPDWFIDELDAGNDPSLWSDKKTVQASKDYLFHLINNADCNNLSDLYHLVRQLDASLVSCSEMAAVPGYEGVNITEVGPNKHRLFTLKIDTFKEVAQALADRREGFLSNEHRNWLNNLICMTSTMRSLLQFQQLVPAGSTISKEVADIVRDAVEMEDQRNGSPEGDCRLAAQVVALLDAANLNEATLTPKTAIMCLQSLYDGTKPLSEFIAQYGEVENTEKVEEAKVFLSEYGRTTQAYGRLWNGLHLEGFSMSYRGRHRTNTSVPYGSSQEDDEEKRPSIAQCIAFIERYGIVFLDEVDKIINTTAFNNDIQKELLTLVEGSKYSITPSHQSFGNNNHASLDTSNVLFIAAGAFSMVSIDDMAPELRGRFPNHATMSRLTEQDLITILEMDSGPMERHRVLLQEEGVNLVFDKEIYPYIANKCVRENNKRDIGARRITDILAQILRPIYLEPERFQGLFVIDTQFINPTVTTGTRLSRVQ